MEGGLGASAWAAVFLELGATGFVLVVRVEVAHDR
jgi:hypothetical protein